MLKARKAENVIGFLSIFPTDFNLPPTLKATGDSEEETYSCFLTLSLARNT